MAGVQFAPMHQPQQGGGGYPQHHAQHAQQAYGGGGYPQNHQVPQLHMQQPQHPHQQQYMQQPNHGQINHGHLQMDAQYYPDHDAKSAGGEQLLEQKMHEIQALRFEVDSLSKATDPNASAEQMAEWLAKQPDPFNEDSEWNIRPKGPCCCIIQ